MSRTASTMEDRSRLIRTFNPGMLQSDDEIIEQFAVRKHELGVINEVLNSNIGVPSCQHILVVAPRGRGKTMLLARVAAELRTNPELASHLLPVRFMEESQEVYNLADFWLETLFHLSKELAADNPAMAHELLESHDALSSRWREAGLEGIVRAAVLDAADRLGRRLVLIVENLQSLCESVDREFGWQLRGALQMDPQIMLLASATCRFEGLDDAEEPFFELFRSIELQPLTTEQCRRLWAAVSGQDLSRREVRPLEILTGGSPRLLLMAAAFARNWSLCRLMDDMVSLVDENTEYFRNHLGSLPNNERRVYVALIDLWKPAGTGEIAARARLGVRIVSTMLKRLIGRGAVIVEYDGAGRKRLYATSERLYSICYKLRRERDEAAAVKSLIRFMVVFYDVAEIFAFWRQRWRDATELASIYTGIENARLRRQSNEGFLLRMNWDEAERANGKVKNVHRMDALTRLAQDLEASFHQENWTRVLDLAGRDVAHELLESVSGWEYEENWVCLAYMKSVAHLKLEEPDQVIVIGNEVAERFHDTQDPAMLQKLCAVAFNAAVANFKLGNFETARSDSVKIVDRIGKYGALQFRQEIATALVLQAKSEIQLKNCESAVVLLNEVLDTYGNDDDPTVQRLVASAFTEKGLAVGACLRDARAAIEVYDQAINRFGQSTDPAIRKNVVASRLYQAFAFGTIGDFEKELTCYDELIASVDSSIVPQEKWFLLIAMAYKSRRLAELGTREEALRICDEYLRRIEDGVNGDYPIETQIWMDWHTRGTRALALMNSGAIELALDEFRSAYALFQSHHQLMMGEMLRLVTELITNGASERHLVSVLAEDREKSATLQPINVVLRQRAGESVRAPVEVLEVAADLLKCIEKRIAEGVMPGFELQV